MLEPVSPDQIWGQMVYGGAPERWMTPEPLEGTDAEPRDSEEPIFHRPAFLHDCDFAGDAYDAHESVSMTPRTTLWLDRTPRHNQKSAPTPPPTAYLLTPPWRQQDPWRESEHDEAHLHPLPPSPPPAPKALPVGAAAPRVFHPPSVADLSARLEAVRALYHKRASSPRPDSPSGDPRSGACSRSTTPFRFLPPLSVRFPRYFGCGAAEEGAQPPVAEDSDSESDAESACDGSELIDWSVFDTVHSLLSSADNTCDLRDALDGDETDTGALADDEKDKGCVLRDDFWGVNSDDSECSTDMDTDSD